MLCIRLICYVALCFGAANAQTMGNAAHLLERSVRLSGVVTDIGGEPLAGVSIDHTGIVGSTFRTNAQGRFAVQTRAPAIVFRKPGFEAKYYRMQRDATIEIMLKPVLSKLKACSSSSNCLSLDLFLSGFCLAKVRGVKATGQSNDIDYGQRQFSIQTPNGVKGIQHIAGPLWGEGLPLDEDVWSSVVYEEKDYLDGEGFRVLDARGTYPTGERWRVLGRAFETASYRNVSVDNARVLDKVLDGVCLHPQR